MSDTPPNNLNPAVAGFFFSRIVLKRRESLAALSRRHGGPENRGVIVKGGTAGQVTGDNHSPRHHHEQGRGNEHQADFSKCAMIGHGRVSKSSQTSARLIRVRDYRGGVLSRSKRGQSMAVP